ncbi:MAG: outer membrane lipoprotein-sorting protein [Saprospiraceae bacterium]
MNYLKLLISIVTFVSILNSLNAQSALDIVKKSDEKMRGTSSYAEMSMKISRPDWSREMKMKLWANGVDQSLILITSPKREQGITFLKDNNEMWNYQPSISRVIKMPPSMMMQSWMGSDFTNDDLAKESSVVTDYDHKLLGSEKVENYDCYIVELIPHEDAPVVWGKVKMWISKNDFLQLKMEFYDEDSDLVSTMYGTQVKNLGGKLLPSVYKLIPDDKPENSTTMTYEALKFGVTFDKDFFTVMNMKKIH